MYLTSFLYFTKQYPLAVGIPNIQYPQNNNIVSFGWIFEEFTGTRCNVVVSFQFECVFDANIHIIHTVHTALTAVCRFFFFLIVYP